jgi:hypothetical protein
MAYGGEATKRGAGLAAGLAALAANIFEWLGLLNKGSASAAAAPDPATTSAVEPISSNTLNVTRVGGVATLISAAGAAAIALFGVDAETTRAPIVVAAYASVGVIVAAALLTAAIIIAADIRARGAIAVGTSSSTSSPVSPAVMSISGTADTEITLAQVYEYVLVNADLNDVTLTLPSAESSEWQAMELKRTDAGEAHNVVVTPVAGHSEDRIALTPRKRTIRVYSTGKAWTVL